ncbi:MAG: HTH domain-containing protein, partial [Anaerorhabdus sp.]
MNIKDELIRYLENQSDYVSAKKIALDFDVSSRTIQSYLKTLRDEGISLETSSKGVRIKDSHSIVINKSSIPETYEARRNWLYKKILLQNRQVHIENSASYLCIGYATFMGELQSIKKDLSKFGLKLKTKNDEIIIEGSEKDKKSFISNMIYRESGSELLSTKSLNEMFPNFDVKMIKKIVQTQIAAGKYYMDEFSLMNLILHILIALNRCEEKSDYREEK